MGDYYPIRFMPFTEEDSMEGNEYWEEVSDRISQTSVFNVMQSMSTYDKDLAGILIFPGAERILFRVSPVK